MSFAAPPDDEWQMSNGMAPEVRANRKRNRRRMVKTGMAVRSGEGLWRFEEPRAGLPGAFGWESERA